MGDKIAPSIENEHIRRLPIENWQQIFEECVKDTLRPPKPPIWASKEPFGKKRCLINFHLSHVCRYFRYIALATPSLWTAIDLNGSLDEFGTIIERSAQLPITIRSIASFYFRYPQYAIPFRDIELRVVAIDTPTQCSDFRMLRHCKNLKRLMIGADLSYGKVEIKHLEYILHDLKSLQSLWWQDSTVSDRYSSKFTSTKQYRLTSLHLAASLSGIYILSLLRCCPALKSASLKVSGAEGTEKFEDGSVPLPDLRNLWLHLSWADSWISKLRLPEVLESYHCEYGCLYSHYGHLKWRLRAKSLVVGDHPRPDSVLSWLVNEQGDLEKLKIIVTSLVGGYGLRDYLRALKSDGIVPPPCPQLEEVHININRRLSDAAACLRDFGVNGDIFQDIYLSRVNAGLPPLRFIWNGKEFQSKEIFYRRSAGVTTGNRAPGPLLCRPTFSTKKGHYSFTIHLPTLSKPIEENLIFRVGRVCGGGFMVGTALAPCETVWMTQVRNNTKRRQKSMAIAGAKDPERGFNGYEGLICAKNCVHASKKLANCGVRLGWPMPERLQLLRISKLKKNFVNVTKHIDIHTLGDTDFANVANVAIFQSKCTTTIYAHDFYNQSILAMSSWWAAIDMARPVSEIELHLKRSAKLPIFLTRHDHLLYQAIQDRIIAFHSPIYLYNLEDVGKYRNLEYLMMGGPLYEQHGEGMFPLLGHFSRLKSLWWQGLDKGWVNGVLVSPQSTYSLTSLHLSNILTDTSALELLRCCPALERVTLNVMGDQYIGPERAVPLTCLRYLHVEFTEEDSWFSALELPPVLKYYQFNYNNPLPKLGYQRWEMEHIGNQQMCMNYLEALQVKDSSPIPFPQLEEVRIEQDLFSDLMMSFWMALAFYMEVLYKVRMSRLEAGLHRLQFTVNGQELRMKAEFLSEPAKDESRMETSKSESLSMHRKNFFKPLMSAISSLKLLR
ncbi:hypothetical protein CPB86DRAFT_828268 [Serendipita vermifera]|nr:hypothetical protein CPB86DRAFT_828268 [Serendipita vermifera]